MTGLPTPVRALLAVPVAEVAVLLERQHSEDLRAAIATARAQGLPDAGMEPDRLARGFRHLLATWCAQERRIPGHGPVASADDSDSIWAVIARRRLSPGSNAAHERECTLLSEMAWSLACEQNTAWHDPPGNQGDVAELVFTRLVQRTSGLLLGSLRKRYGRVLASVDDVVMCGCAEAFRYYWSRTARTRFLVTSKVSTLLYATIVHEARRQLTEVPQDQGYGEGRDETEPDAASSLDLLPGRATDLEGFIVRDAFHHCLEKLTERKKMVVVGRLVDGKSNLEIASELGVTPPATTMQYQQALRELMECMRAQGVDG